MADRTFLVGSTVRLVVRVSKPGTRDPDNPAEGVTLRALACNGVPVLTVAAAFTLVADGLYELALDTEEMAPGVYTWLASAVDNPQAIAQIEDTFVLVDRALNPVSGP